MRSNSDCGIASPSVLAVFWLTTSWNLVGCSTGSSAGFEVKIAGRNHFDKPLTIIGDHAYSGRRGVTGQFVTVAQPAVCTATASDALRFSEPARFEIANADHRLLVRRQVRSPYAKGAVFFDCSASHFREARVLQGADADSRPSLTPAVQMLGAPGVVFICRSLQLQDGIRDRRWLVVCSRISSGDCAKRQCIARLVCRRPTRNQPAHRRRVRVQCMVRRHFHRGVHDLPSSVFCLAFLRPGVPPQVPRAPRPRVPHARQTSGPAHARMKGRWCGRFSHN